MNHRSSVIILILHYGDIKVTTRLIESLKNIRYDNFHTLILDNDPKNRLKIENDSNITVIRSKKNLGYAKGIKFLTNKALSEYPSEYVLLLNNDTVIEPSILKDLTEALGKNDAAISPLITYGHQTDKIWFNGGYFNDTFYYTTHPDMNKKIDKKQKEKTLKNTNWLTGCAMLIKSSALKDMGTFDPKFYAYSEDVDWSLRAKDKGFTLKVLKKPLVRHFVSSSFGKDDSNVLTPNRAYYYARNNFLLIKKHSKGLTRITAICGQLCIRLPYFSLNMLLTGQFKSIPHYLKGLKDGFNLLFS